ncbi:MAG: cytochrome c [Roseivirga sp.]|nr:cytochrome c [Roseivirga sp.]
MEKNIVLIHSAVAVFMVLYLIIRLLISLFMLRDRERQLKFRQRFKKADWIFAALVLLSGLYPLSIPDQFELYHLVKLLVLILFIWLSRYVKSLNFALVTLISTVLVLYAGYASFTDQPVFPKKQVTFEQANPDDASLSALEKGQLIFTTHCTACHGTNGKLGRFGAADLTLSKLSLEQKIDIISNGSPLTVMRSFTNDLSQEEIRQVAAFVHGLAEE